MLPVALKRSGPALGLALGVAVVSTAALLVRWALDAGAQPLAVAAARLTLAALLMWPICWWSLKHDGLADKGKAVRQARLPGGLVAWILVAGVSLAAHFAAWISSLHYTSVASSVALVTTNPIWVALGAWLVFRDRPGARVWAAIALSLAGSLLISWSDLMSPAVALSPFPEASADLSALSDAQGSDPLRGNALALLGAVAMSGYMLAARAVKRRDPTIGLLRYVAMVYSVAAVALSLCAWLAGAAWWALPAPAWPALILLALGPQVLGHTLINHALRHLAPTVVALAILGEPIGAALLAYALLNEVISAGQLLGFCMVILAVVLAR